MRFLCNPDPERSLRRGGNPIVCQNLNVYFSERLECSFPRRPEAQRGIPIAFQNLKAHLPKSRA